VDVWAVSSVPELKFVTELITFVQVIENTDTYVSTVVPKPLPTAAVLIAVTTLPAGHAKGVKADPPAPPSTGPLEVTVTS